MVSRDDVVHAYRLFLQRLPENEQVIDSHSQAEDIDQLRWTIMRSPEYIHRILTSEDIHRVPLLTFTHIHAIRMTGRMQEHLATLGLPLHNRTVVEIGAGIGMHASFFLDRGCSVLSTDGRPENVDTMKAIFHAYGWYPRHNEIQTAIFDIENDDPASLGQFDIVYCYGLLYHTKAPGLAIRKLSELCSDILLLETSVSFGDGYDVIFGSEDAAMVSQGIHGAGSHPTRPWVLRELGRYFPYVYVPRTQPNHEYFLRDWVTPPPPSNQAVRAIFIASRTELKNDALLTELPNRQGCAP